MNQFLKGLNAVIGFAGSSENPQAMSLRLMGIIMGIIGKATPAIIMVIAWTGAFQLPAEVTPKMVADQLSPIVQVGVYMFAASMWLMGAFRAFWGAYKEKLQGILGAKQP